MSESTVIYLRDVDTTLAVPTDVLPTAQDQSTDRLAHHLASLYIGGNILCDSHDVGLRYNSQANVHNLHLPAVDRPSAHQRVQLRKERVVGLTTSVSLISVSEPQN